MSAPSAISSVYEGRFDDAKVGDWVRETRGRLPTPHISLGALFLTPGLMDDSAQILELVRLNAGVPILVGCSSPGLIVGDRELEETEGMVLGLYDLPGAELRPFHFTQRHVEEANGPAYWHHETGVTPERTNGWLVFADPFHLDVESWLRDWNEAYAPLPVLGGLSGGDMTVQRTQVFLDGEALEEGGVALSVGGAIRLAGVVSQGCTPIGETWTITRAERNLIHQIGNRPAYEVLLETFSRLSPEDQRKAQGNLFVGLVVNEYLDEFRRGDFLIRNLLGADPKSGTLAVGAWPRPGQSLQFQRRDPEAASEDLAKLLSATRNRLGNATVLGGCLCSCNGRGQRMFGHPNHDAALVQHQLELPGLTGFFCNGEIGPVGDRNFLHGFTASLALFVRKADGASS
jgi:small ligand-binding sensory domain FIST